MSKKHKPIPLAYPLQAAGAFVLFALFGLLPLDAASALGGLLGRAIGPFLPHSRLAARNLTRAMPELRREEVKRVVRGMWDNLGRVVAEYPHLHRIACYDGSRVEVVGAEGIDLIRDDHKGAIFFSGHLGNWEISSLAATQRGMPIIHIYRAPNNPIVDRLIFKFRARAITGEHFPKGTEGGRQIMRHLAKGRHLGMLVDQKLNEGIPAPFFGRDAMTMTALAAFALKFLVPIVPVRVERLKGARFRITVLPPMEVADTGEREADIARVMGDVNALLEGWIRERPEQWLWVHRRWPD